MKKFRPEGELWLSLGGENVLGRERIRLLREIDATGSITAAALAAGISYKTAWDALDRLNRLAEVPLVESSTGGKRGGGSRLTGHGRKLLETYDLLQAENELYLKRLRLGAQDLERFLKLTRKISVKTSARNQLHGKVVSVKKEGLTAEVVLGLPGGDSVVARITADGLEDLGLRTGEEAYALVKANWVMLALVGGEARLSARNRLRGRIVKLEENGASDEARVELPGGAILTSLLTRDSAHELGLREGTEVYALFKASSVILGVAR